jgi:hypothetical protein
MPTPILLISDAEARVLLKQTPPLETVAVIYFFGLDRGRVRRTLAETSRLIGKSPSCIRGQIERFLQRPVKIIDPNEQNLFDFKNWAEVKFREISLKSARKTK